VLFFLAPMPEITDADMGTQEMEIAEYDPGPFKNQINLFLAVWSQFCYVGAQVAVANYFVNFCEEAGKTAAQSCKSPQRKPVPTPFQIANEKQPISLPLLKASTHSTVSLPVA
jgi:hypothetical protein